MKRRAQTSTERDLEGLAAKRRRETGAPEHVEKDITGTYSHDPILLQQYRSKRSTGERLEHLEVKYDRLVGNVLASRTKIIVTLVGALTGLLGYLLGGGV